MSLLLKTFFLTLPPSLSPSLPPSLAREIITAIMEQGPQAIHLFPGGTGPGNSGSSFYIGGGGREGGREGGRGGSGARLYTVPIDGTASAIDIPKSQVGKIIGRGGEIVALIQEKSGCRLQIAQDVPEGMPCRVAILGGREGGAE
jgi:hypothetical protein